MQTTAILISNQNEIDKEPKLKKYVSKIKKNVKLMVVKILLFLDKARLIDPGHLRKGMFLLI